MITIKQAALGAAAGIAATFIMQGLLEQGQKHLPEGTPPIKKDPGEFMIEKLKPLAAKSMHLGYGMTAGMLYGLLPHSRWRTLEGVALGLGVWAAGYLGWLPATKLMPPLTEQTPAQITVPVVQHALFGVAVAKAFEAMAA
ncbi:MAG TPA: hypothetical protein VJ901_19285 [Thermoanaerobaculia bacterium]|nr:hypothetical protein [Thermoanaerobaculia bacterium]